MDRLATPSGRLGSGAWFKVAAQRMGKSFRDLYFCHLPHEGGWTREVHDPVVFGATHQLLRVSLRRSFDQDALGAPNHRCADRLGSLIDGGLQLLQPAQLYLFGRVVLQVGGGCAGSAAVDEGKTEVEADLVD